MTRGLLLGLAGAVISGLVVVYANIGATDIGGGTETIDLSVNSFTGDTEVTVANSDISIVAATAAAAGTSAPGIEANVATFPAVNNALTADNYSYTFEMKETANGDWLVSENFRIRVYGHDTSGPTTTLLATLYTQQASNNAAAAVEGVTVTVDLGLASAVYNNFDIIVDRQ